MQKCQLGVQSFPTTRGLRGIPKVFYISLQTHVASGTGSVNPDLLPDCDAELPWGRALRPRLADVFPDSKTGRGGRPPSSRLQTQILDRKWKSHLMISSHIWPGTFILIVNLQ